MDQDSLGMEVGLGPGDIVLDGDQAPLLKNGAQPPIFGSRLLWPNGWMDQDATLIGIYDGRPRPRRPERGTIPLIFGPCLLWPNVALLSYC